MFSKHSQYYSFESVFQIFSNNKENTQPNYKIIEKTDGPKLTSKYDILDCKNTENLSFKFPFLGLADFSSESYWDLGFFEFQKERMGWN